jgi:hypothetical protein
MGSRIIDGGCVAAASFLDVLRLLAKRASALARRGRSE